MPLKYLASAVILILAFWGCVEKEESNQTEIREIQIDTLYTFTSFEEHNIAQPSQVEVLENGNIAIVDFGQHKVNILQTDGELVTSFGREGRGPGEFIQIGNLFNTGDVVHVIDINQSVISKFDLDGNFLTSHTFKSEAILKEVAAINHNQYAIASGGAENALLSITNFNTDSTFYFGNPKEEIMEIVDFQASLNQLKNGEIPGFFKNLVTLRSDGEHIYAYLRAYSELHKYDTSGNLIWEQKLDLPYNEEIFNRTVEQAKNVSGGIPTYNYISDFEIFAQETILLTNRRNSDDSQLLVRLNKSGKTTAIYTLPKHIGYLSAFDWNPINNTAYFASFGDGIVYRSEISF